MVTAPARDGRPVIGIFGTFDVENYGDLLFPLLAEQRLGGIDAEIVAVSPTASATRFADARQAISVDDFAMNEAPAGVLIGGGNIAHVRDFRIPAYADVPGHVAYPSLWIGATLLGAIHRCPVVWNAPGAMPFDTGAAAQPILAAAFAGATYLAVRDEWSAGIVAPLAPRAPLVVPDPALDLDRVWSRDRLAETFGGILAQHGVSGEPNTLAVHVKARSLGGLSVEAFAARLDVLSVELGMMPVLVAIGPVHRDDELARAVSAALKVRHVTLDAPERLEDIASVIACSRASMVASLHGFITATVYGTPAALVAAPELAKFRGFAQQVRRDADVVERWSDAFDHISAHARDHRSSPPAPVAARQRLEEHWAAVTQILGAAVERRRAPDLPTALAGGACRHGRLTALLATALAQP